MVANAFSSRLPRVLGAVTLAVAMLAVTGCGEFYGRDDFKGYVMSKSDAEVVKKIGKPAAVNDSDPKRVTWTYNSVTYDVDNQNKKDSRTLVIFSRDPQNGKMAVVDVQFEH